MHTVIKNKMFLRRAIGLLTRFKSTPTCTFTRSTTTTADINPFFLTTSITANTCFSSQYGSEFSTLRKHQKSSAFWTLLYGPVAIFLGMNVNLSFAEDGPVELGNGIETGEAGLPGGMRRIEDGSVKSNKHTSKWWIFTKMARELHQQGKLEEAERYFLLALREAEEGFGARDPHVASACNNLAEIYRVRKAFDKANPLYLKAVTILEESYGPDDIRVGVAFDNLGQFYLVQQKLEEARLSYEHALKIKRRILGHAHTDYADTMYHLGRVMYLQGNEKDSEALIKDSIRILEEAGEEESVKCLRRLRYLSQIYRKSARLTEAENIQRKILHIVELSQGWNSLDTANAAEELAVTLQSIGNLNEALELLERCLDARKKLLDENNIQIGANMLRMAQFVMLNSNRSLKVDFAAAIAEIDKAKNLLDNSIKIARNILDTVKAKRINMRNKGLTRAGKDEQAALFILLQSFIALGLLEITKTLQEPSEERPRLAEAERAFCQCMIAFKEAAQSGTPKSVYDSPEVKGEYLSCLKHLLHLMRKTGSNRTEQSNEPTLQDLEDEIKRIEAELREA